MSRPMTSNVSTLSGCVANGHQAVHHVSSSLSKIPYGGFSPVRLQTELPGRHLRPRAHTRRLIGGQQVRRSAPVALTGNLPLPAVCGVSGEPLRSRGPWLAGGLFCPASSNATMASSEPLASIHRLIVLRPEDTWDARGSQLLSACPWFRAACLTPASQVEQAVVFSTRGSLRHHPMGSAPAGPGKSVHARPCNEAAQFACAAARNLASPFTDKGFYIRAFIP